MAEPNKGASSHISAKEFRRLYEAVAVANRCGWVLNTFLTVSWEVAGVLDPGVNRACHDRLIENMRTWFRDQQKAYPQFEIPYAGIWVREDGKVHGLHSHILVHVPLRFEIAFKRWVVGAVERIVRKLDRGLSPGKQGVLTFCGPNFGRDTDQQWRIFRYLMKGLDPEALSMATRQGHLAHLLENFAHIKLRNQGRIEGIRCGASHSLGPKVREMCNMPPAWPLRHVDGKGLPYDRRFLDWHEQSVSGSSLDSLNI